jgi:hypothetical protein
MGWTDKAASAYLDDSANQRANVRMQLWDNGRMKFGRTSAGEETYAY